MEIVRQIVDSSLLDNVISLPISIQHRRVEVIVLPTTEDDAKLSVTSSEIDKMLEGSITQSLLGIIENQDISLGEITGYKEGM
ncbi:MAG: hypothetical protein LBB66_02835 [Desulfovibrio sp.]|jgi:hypothetical protein|nr:hypothetical protein [Desulfovibrio sp.]